MLVFSTIPFHNLQSMFRIHFKVSQNKNVSKTNLTYIIIINLKSIIKNEHIFYLSFNVNTTIKSEEYNFNTE